jgi:hypothetical protein
MKQIQSLDTRIELILKASENLIAKSQDHENRISYLEKHMPVDRRSALNIKSAATKHVTAILGGKGSEAYKKHFRETISRFWHDYWQVFGVTSYLETPAKQYDNALDYIKTWRPLTLVGLEPEPAA